MIYKTDPAGFISINDIWCIIILSFRPDMRNDLKGIHMRRIITFLLTISVLFSLGGCFLFRPSNEPSHSRHTLLNYCDNDQTVVAARVWTNGYGELDEPYIQEVSEDRLDELIEEISKTRISSHFGHTDYFYKGQYGIELTLSDGTYLIYDCTKLTLYDKPYDIDNRKFGEEIKSYYIEDTGKDFWERISPFFPDMDTQYFSYGW